MVLDGWKMYLVGTAMVLVGACGLIVHFVEPGSPVAMDPDAAKALILTGLGMFGVGHKLDKLIAAAKRK